MVTLSSIPRYKSRQFVTFLVHSCQNMCRYVFLTNQRVETPSTWANSQPDLAEAEEAGAANFKSLGCQWASVDVMDGQEASAASSASTDTAAGATTATATSGAPKTNGTLLLLTS